MSRYFTKEGYEKLKKKLEELKEERKKIAKRIEKAKAMGDISENASYDKAKEDQAFNEGKIQEIKGKLREGEVVDKSGSSKVGVGSKVVVEAEGEKKEFQIVGEGEGDPMEGKISYESPLGEKLRGKKEGDEVELDQGSKEIGYLVVEVE